MNTETTQTSKAKIIFWVSVIIALIAIAIGTIWHYKHQPTNGATPPAGAVAGNTNSTATTNNADYKMIPRTIQPTTPVAGEKSATPSGKALTMRETAIPAGNSIVINGDGNTIGSIQLITGPSKTTDEKNDSFWPTNVINHIVGNPKPGEYGITVNIKVAPGEYHQVHLPKRLVIYEHRIEGFDIGPLITGINGKQVPTKNFDTNRVLWFDYWNTSERTTYSIVIKCREP